MTSITLQVPDNRANDLIMALKDFGLIEINTEINDDDEIGIHSMEELTALTYPGLTQEQILGERLKTARTDAEMTQKALAERIGVAQSHIAEMEKAKRPIGKAMAKKLAVVFGRDYRVFL
jgi:DNA-binding XRE family transcriptional regulator